MVVIERQLNLKRVIMKNLELENFGVIEMNNEECKNQNGGAFWIPLAVGAALLISAINNFGDIADGFVDGVNGREPRHHHN